MSSSKRQTKKKTTLRKNLEIITIKDEKEYNKFNMKINPDMVYPKFWELSNRKTFYNWLIKYYKIYDTAEKKMGTSKKSRIKKLDYFPIQKLVRDLMQGESPYRGLLLYHGLGVGKTCAAIAIASAIQNKKKVFILSKAGLEDNFRSNIFKCGSDHMRLNNYWVFSKVRTELEEKLVKELDIPQSIIDKNNGVFLADPTEPPNIQDLTRYEGKILDQINACIQKRFKFIHLDDTRITSKIKEDEFDNSVIIVDEVHNLTNSMANGSPTGNFFYNSLMNAKNCKIIFLSGTPIINNVFETSKLYNILRGYIPTVIYRIIPNFGKNIEWNGIKQRLVSLLNTDQVVFDKIKKTVKITKTPNDFVNFQFKGLKYDPEKSQNMKTFEQDVNHNMVYLGKNLGFTFKESFEMNTCLPEDIKEFNRTFYNIDANKLKKPDVLKKRIAGLTSYYEKVDKSLFPELRTLNIVVLPMSNYMLSKYQEIRIIELEKEEKMKKQRKGDDKLQSSYRIGSRLHCTFAFPEEIGSPYDKSKLELYSNLERLLDTSNTNGDIDKNDIMVKKISKTTKRLESQKDLEKVLDDDIKSRKEIEKKYLEALRKEKATFMSIDNGSLGMYSPKYKEIIQKIQSSEGCCFVYSQFISLVGLNTLGIAFDATNEYCELKIVKNDEQYLLDENPDDFDKKKYIFFSGNIKDKKLKEIYRLLFNSEFDSLPPSCTKMKRQLKRLYGEEQNLHGNVIKVFMTTRTGAEGVDLKHIRQVHVMEPYWQPVLTKQVIGRAVRFESHTRLPKNERFVDVFIYMMKITNEQLKSIASSAIRQDVARYNDGLGKKGKVVTSDEQLYIVSERKKLIINDTQKIIKESAIDCILNYNDNLEDNPDLACLNYDVDSRFDEVNYLYTPGLEDTIDFVEMTQEYDIPVQYGKLELPPKSGHFYYMIQNPQPGQKQYLYDESIIIKARRPKPVGEIVFVNGKKKVKFFKKPKSPKSPKSSKSSNKSKKKHQTKTNNII
jgi:hypothetical protein